MRFAICSFGSGAPVRGAPSVPRHRAPTRNARSTRARMYQAHDGESPATYHQRMKMARAQELLESNRFSVKEIAYALGYKRPNDFSRAFKHFVGKSPKSCRE